MTEGTPSTRSINSINHISENDLGAVVVASSHGGLYSAYKAVTARVRGIILNDAGRGRDDAGVASLDFCGRYGVPAAVVSYMSARIGDVADMEARGTISDCNELAARLGVTPGMRVADATACLLQGAFTAPGTPDEVSETRHEEPLAPGAQPLVCIDSASLIRPEDAGRVVITGSHGGLIGGDPHKAINVECAFAAFNDAGVGIDDAGIGRLAPLDRRGIPAVTVDYMSARIGDARSTLHDGVISRANDAAAALGMVRGRPLAQALRAWLAG